MIIVRTDDDWSAATITVDDGGGPQVWSCSASARSAYEAAADLAAWLATTYATIAAVSWGAAGDGRLAAVVGVGVTLTTITPSAAATTLLAPATTAPAAQILLASCVGTAYASRIGWRQEVWTREPSPAAGAGAVSARPPATMAALPDVAYALDDDATQALLYALRRARTPREAYLYDDESWRLASLGRVSVPQTPYARVVRLEVAL